MIRKAVLLGFGVRLCIAIWNGFFGPSYGAEADAESLHEMAAAYAAGTLTGDLRLHYSYAYALGLIYRYTWDSLFLGSLLSCLAWFGSALALLGSLRVLGAGARATAAAMLIYALLPSSILWTSVTLREPFQLLLINVATFAALKIMLHGRHAYWVALVAAVPIGAALHAGLFGWAVVVLIATIGASVLGRIATGPVRIAAVVVVSAAVLGLGYVAFRNLFDFALDQGLAAAVSNYQRGGLSIGVRTDYRTAVTLEGLVDLLLFVPICLVQYLFEPTPWRVTALPDLEPLLENLLRAGLIAQAVAVIYTFSATTRRMTMFVLACYLVLETAWSLGTFNWGTAARHHIPALGLLLLAAFAIPESRRAAQSSSAEITSAA